MLKRRLVERRVLLGHGPSEVHDPLVCRMPGPHPCRSSTTAAPPSRDGRSGSQAPGATLPFGPPSRRRSRPSWRPCTRRRGYVQSLHVSQIDPATPWSRCQVGVDCIDNLSIEPSLRCRFVPPASPKHTRDTRTSAPSMTRRWPRAGRVAVEIAPDRRPSGRLPPGRAPFHILCGERLGSRAGSRKAKEFAAALLAGEEGSAAGGASSAFTPSGVRSMTRCGLPSRR